MSVGAGITIDHASGFRAEIATAAHGTRDDFFRWFNNNADADDAFRRGQWDFSLHIAAPAARYIDRPGDRTALEIGYGGGRILAATARAFGRVVGVDIHDNRETVLDELHRRGISNAELVQGDGASLPVADASIDLVYSFIVFQHLEHIETVRAYLRETQRVLTPTGIAVIYVARYCRFSKDRTGRARLLIDSIAERVAMPAGFVELPARVNETNLRITAPYFKRIARETGLETLGRVISHRGLPDGFGRMGGQHGFILRPA